MLLGAARYPITVSVGTNVWWAEIRKSCARSCRACLAEKQRKQLFRPFGMDTQGNALPKLVEIVAVVHGVEAVVDSVDALANRRVRFSADLWHRYRCAWAERRAGQ